MERFRAREWDHEFGNRMAENLLDGHAKRRQILGKKMELSGIDLNGKPVDFQTSKTIGLSWFSSALTTNM